MRPLRVFLALLILALLLFPYASLVLQLRGWRFLSSGDLNVYSFTVLQAGLSSLFSLVVGAWGASGLLWIRDRYGLKALQLAEFFALLPNAAPVILILLASMKLFPFARGIVGIVLLHVILNSGLVAVSLVSLCLTKIGSMGELAWIEGASRFRFVFRIAYPYLKPDIETLALFVFAICFTSFSIPLMIGGASATTVETLIYQKVRIVGAWDQAVTLALFQTAWIFLLAWRLRSRHQPVFVSREVSLPILTEKSGLLPILAPVVILVLGLFSQLARGIPQLAILDGLGVSAVGSVFVGITTGLISATFLLALGYVNPRGPFRRFLLGYAAPSAALTGFALLYFWRATGFASFVKIAIGLSLVSVPAFYRLYWDQLLGGLAGQRAVAATMGASEVLIFRKIFFPQVVRPLSKVSGLAAVWAWGDFSLSSVIAERPMTLAMIVQSLMATYRFPAATALIWLVIAGAALTYLFFLGVGRVLGSQPAT